MWEQSFEELGLDRQDCSSWERKEESTEQTHKDFLNMGLNYFALALVGVLI